MAAHPAGKQRDHRHVGCTVYPGADGRGHVVCTCGREFPAYRHPVEDQWESPQWIKHAKFYRDGAS